ncbi:hypothetical protein [Hyphomicrobium sp. DY-1]|uniref:hypothetical protein n=1 Tax=Hyphomicrobium sp. DY-1 TaxID=3075650 RepID=UPI0039C12873
MSAQLFEIFRSTMMENPDASRREAQDEFVLQMQSDQIFLDLLARDYFDRMAAVWTVRSSNLLGNAFTRTDVAQDNADRRKHPHQPPSPMLVRRTREESAARTAIVFEQMKAKVRSVVLLDLLLPNGKALRDATGAECAKAGGFFVDVAKAIKPTQVVDRHLSEGDLQNIRARFYQANGNNADERLAGHI